MKSSLPNITDPAVAGKTPYRALLDNLPAVIFYLDGDQTFRYANKKCLQWLGAQEDTLIGTGVSEVFNEKAFELFASYLQKTTSGEVVSFESGIRLNSEDRDCFVEGSITTDQDEQGRIRGYFVYLQEITEKKEIQKALEQKNKELQDYVDHGAIGLHWVDENGIILWANKAELDLLGYSKEEYFGHHISEFHVNQDKINDILNRLSCNETLKSYESELRCKDGSTRIVHISSNVYRENGRFIHTRCFTVDVTEEKKLFRELQESESRYRFLMQSLDTPLYTTDREGRITFYNQAAAALWGREPELGKDLWCGSWKIYHTDGSPMPLDHCPMAISLKEERPVLGEEIVVVRPDGSLRHVIPHPQPLFDASGHMTGAINMLVDITEIKHTEQALRENEAQLRELTTTLENKVEERTKDLERKNEELRKSEERYHKMVVEVEDYAIILLDRNGIIQNWNKGAEKIKGYTEEEIIGRSFRVFYLPEDQQKGLPNYLIQQAGINGKALHEGWRVRKNGSVFWGSTVLTALHDELGQVIGFSKVTRDLTERKMAEEKMMKYTQELEFQNKELEQFAYVASHDMKEPLRKIIFYNSYIYDEVAGLLTEKQREYLHRSISSAKRMKLLIDDLLTYSRISFQNQNLEPVDLNEILYDALSAQKEMLEEHNVIIEREQLPVIKAIPFQMQQLFDNLLTNAIKYRHPERTPLVRISCQKVKGVHINEKVDHPDQHYYKISFTDNGIGFHQAHAEKIFELFQRLKGTSDSSGTGIGLAICRRITQNHQGFIEASGKVNEGAQFCVYLPCSTG